MITPASVDSKANTGLADSAKEPIAPRSVAIHQRRYVRLKGSFLLAISIAVGIFVAFGVFGWLARRDPWFVFDKSVFLSKLT
jgi:hypothetical protein